MIAPVIHAFAQAVQAELARLAAARRRARARLYPSASAGNVAFVCLFAAQAGLLTLSPILPSVARDFGVSTAAAGQLRTLVGLVGSIAALAVVLVGRRVGLRRLLLAGNGLLAAGSVASAASPSLIALAAGQVAVGAATGLLVSAGLAAAATWVPTERRAATLAWASLGQPASWVAGMPLIGLSADLGWRYAWLGVPLVAALAGIAAVASEPRERCGRGGRIPRQLRGSPLAVRLRARAACRTGTRCGSDHRPVGHGAARAFREYRDLHLAGSGGMHPHGRGQRVRALRDP
jgi:predicted MFS family arabinose efflux permease